MATLLKQLLLGTSVVAAFTVACQRANFEGRNSDKEPAQEKTPDEPAADAEVPLDQDVDDPQQIAGAMLTCAPAVDADAPVAGTGWLCRIDRNGALADLSLGAVTWTLADAAGHTVASLPAAANAAPTVNDPEITPLLNAAPWHVSVRYPKAPAGAAALADVNWSDGTSSHLKTVLDSSGDVIWHLGAARDIHLGDGEFPDGGCKGPIAQTPLTGANMSIPLTVTSDTTLEIEITDVCGIDFDEVDLTVNGPAGVVHTARLPIGESHVKLAPFKLPKGKLTLTIEPQPATSTVRPDDRDDFVFGNVYFSGKHFSLGTPKAK